MELRWDDILEPVSDYLRKWPHSGVMVTCTQEFYALRAEITKYLIKNRGFEVVLCEADWPFLCVERLHSPFTLVRRFLFAHQ